MSSSLLHLSPSILTHQNLAVILPINHYYYSLLPDHVGYLQNILALIYALVILLSHDHTVSLVCFDRLYFVCDIARKIPGLLICKGALVHITDARECTIAG